ncbi:MAG TPA: superoxide dismutase [Candidatus Eisenbacteria bacterium]|nr:superoxide dismutase [Candidatus Eisenbacteria bacterium]
MAHPIYKAREFSLSGLSGISDRTIEMHLGLYQGYVKNTNLLLEQLEEIASQGQARGTNPEYAEITRRLGFEYGGMVLHEYYFENLAPKGRGEPSQELSAALAQNFGSYEKWKECFMGVGEMRGVGWAILYRDPTTGRLSNHWVGLHQDGVPSGFDPIVVMDVWEHAFLLDYKPSERGKYIEAFFANVNWDPINARLREPARPRAAA